MLSKKCFVMVVAMCFCSTVFAVLPDPNDGWVPQAAITLTASDSGEISWNPPVNIINGSGLTADLKHLSNSNDIWTFRINDGRWLPEWRQGTYLRNYSPSGISADGWVQFEFSEPQTISQIWVWNYNASTTLNRGWEFVAIDYSVDGTTWERLGGGDTYITFAKGTGLDSYECNNKIDFGGLTVVKIVMNLRWADGNYGDPSYNGLSEVLFSTDLSLIDPIAENPSPVDGFAFASITNLELSWTAGETAAYHDVYLGSDPVVVAGASRANPQGVLVSQGQTENTYTLPVLANGTTYYWRIDEVEDNGLMIWEGDVWSFTTLSADSDGWINGNNILVTVSSEVAGMPATRTIDGSGLSANLLHDTNTTHFWTSYRTNGGDRPSPSGSTGAAWIAYEFPKVYELQEMWVWNYNPDILLSEQRDRGLKKVYIDYSADGITWTRLTDDPNEYFLFPKAPGENNYASNKQVDFGGLGVKYVVITAPLVDGNYGYDDYYGLSEVRFAIPELASEPTPFDGCPFAAVDSELGWTIADNAVYNDVYFGTDQAAVASATRANPQGVLLSQGQSGTSYIPTLTYGTTYYWRIDGVGSDGLTIFQGPVWSFRTISDDNEGWINGDNILVTTSSEVGGMSGTKTIDGSGLSADLLHDTNSINFWTTYHTVGGMTPSPSGSTGAAWIAYEFGKVYQLETMWVWNYNADVLLSEQRGRGLKNVQIDYSSDGVNWTRLMDGANDYFVFPLAPGTDDYASDIKIDFGGLNVSYVVLTAPLVDGNYGYDDFYGLSEVRFKIPSDYATTPSPANLAQNVSGLNVLLSWMPGDSAVSHNVYFGSDFTDVQNATALFGDLNGSGYVDLIDISILAGQWLKFPPASSQYWADLNDDNYVDFDDLIIITQNWLQSGDGIYRSHYPLSHSSYEAGNLLPGTTYYWRIDEINGNSLWPGMVWSFTTAIE